MTPAHPMGASETRARRINLLLVVAAVSCLVWLVKDYRWSVVINSAPLLLKGLWYSWVLTLACIAIGLPCGILLALGRRSRIGPVRYVSGAYVEIVRATPQLLVIFLVYFAVPALFGTRIPSWPAAILSLSMMAAAYLAEVVRGGLKSVPSVLIETGFSSGLSRMEILRFIVIPQALRTMIPAIIAHVVMMFKITSLIYIVGINDFFRSVVLVNNRVYEPIPLYLTLAFGYFICCYLLSRLVRLFDNRAAATV